MNNLKAAGRVQLALDLLKSRIISKYEVLNILEDHKRFYLVNNELLYFALDYTIKVLEIE